MSKKSKILKTLTVFGAAVCAPLLLTGCNTTGNNIDPTNFRVQDGWVQFTKDGENWTNLIEAEYPTSNYDFRIYNGYVQWTTDGIIWKDLINIEEPEEEIKTYTITYDYGASMFLFKDHPQTSSVKENTWVMDLPEIEYEYYKAFKGWFIQGTDKQITEYDYIAGDVTLEARFDFTSSQAPAGSYNYWGKFDQSWHYLTTHNVLVVGDGVLTCKSKFTGANVNLKIDNSVTAIGEEAFSGNDGLRSVIIPDSVNSIGYRSFASCGVLTTVKIGNGVEEIGEGAFENCYDLTNVSIGKGVKFIGAEAFVDCRNLSNITIPENVLMIESGAFAGCNNLTSITFISSSYNWKAYNHGGDIVSQDVLSLTDDKIASYFRSGYEFKQVYTCMSVDYVLVRTDYDSYYILVPMSDKSITEIDLLPVREIEEYAFRGCDKLTSIIISDSVMKIGERVFGGCDKLTTITFEEKEGYKWQVYASGAWRDADASELFELAKSGLELKRVEI